MVCTIHGQPAAMRVRREECKDEICRRSPRMVNAGAALSGLKTLVTSAITKEKREMGEMTAEIARYGVICFYS